MKNLLGMTLAQLQQMVVQHGLPKYAAGQIARWLYQKRVGTIEEMTDLSKAAREKLSAEYQVGHIAPAEVLCSSDGTKKYAFPATCSQDSANEQRYIEAVMIP
ncbi:MAG: 23S rRNA (adenine(2503)-C(2))-methyltransferase RlmN, partial [Bacteroidales bacterium]|nr:23S rRNA (adenine(2503)-C(2))-methyltransferase RlmN [Bacteroidales bacterium]